MIKNPIQQLKDIKQRRDERPKELQIPLGGQDIMDLISYGGLEEQPDYLYVDGQYIRTIMITGYPYNAELGWLNSLINFHHNADISFQIQQVDSNEALKKLTRKITELESTKRQRLRTGGIIGPEIDDPLESATELRNGIQRGQEKLFQVSIYVAVIADTLEELSDVTVMLASSLQARLFYTKVAKFQQLDGLQSVLPRAQDVLKSKRNLNSSTAALAFPFISSELVQESGILYGVNKSNNSLVILDRFKKLHNANGILFGQSGSGKSYTSKVEILRHLTQGTKVIVIDPEREYENLAKSVNGTYINLSTNSAEKINPFDLATTSHSKEQLAEHAQDLTEVISLMAASNDVRDKTPGLDARERAAVDKAILKVYKDAKKGTTPVLSDLYAELNKMGQIALCERLDKYLSGTLAGVFNEQTNIKLDNRLIIFDIKDLPESLRQIMMMIIANFVQNTVKSKPEKRMLVIDEGWLLLEHEESAKFVAGLVRRARKYYLGVTLITQQANDFLNNKYGRAIASQSSFRILMKQDTTTIKNVASEFQLSDYEKRYLLRCAPGDALIIADEEHVAVHVTASAEEHPLITTDPSEVHAK